MRRRSCRAFQYNKCVLFADESKLRKVERKPQTCFFLSGIINGNRYVEFVRWTNCLIVRSLLFFLSAQSRLYDDERHVKLRLESFN